MATDTQEPGDACECPVQGHHGPDDEGCLDRWEHSNGRLLCSRPAGHDGPHAACNRSEHPVMVWPRDTDGLPDGWERIDPDGPYHKLVTRDAVTVDRDGREAYDRDVVVLVAEETVGIVNGPAAHMSWSVDDPGAAAQRVVAALDEWVGEGGDPYGGPALDQRLDAAVREGDHEQ